MNRMYAPDLMVFFICLQESLESTEFLLQNGAKLHLRDSRGRGCLHHAAYIGAIGLVL